MIEQSTPGTRNYPLALGTLASATLTVDHGERGKVETITFEVPKFGPEIVLNFVKKSPNVVVNVHDQEVVVGSGDGPKQLDVDHTRPLQQFAASWSGQPVGMAASTAAGGRESRRYDRPLARQSQG